MKNIRLIAIYVIILVLLNMATALSARVISSQTLTIHAYIPERTVVKINDSGMPVLDSNHEKVELDVYDVDGWTVVSLTAR
ncbi:MAG: hypothetical protein WCR91_04870 [Sphaerochaetaceae bacterium]|nr:hypothetical protein [Sphaerochaetaceae bacterium]